jgi:signal transduction histidine kinase
MGLASMRRIMERHGGSVHAESVPGEGAVFTLAFPPAAVVVGAQASGSTGEAAAARDPR